MDHRLDTSHLHYKKNTPYAPKASCILLLLHDKKNFPSFPIEIPTKLLCPLFLTDLSLTPLHSLTFPGTAQSAQSCSFPYCPEWQSAQSVQSCPRTPECLGSDMSFPSQVPFSFCTWASIELRSDQCRAFSKDCSLSVCAKPVNSFSIATKLRTCTPVRKIMTFYII